MKLFSKITILSMLVLPIVLSAQIANSKKTQIETSASQKQSFEDFCIENASYFIEIPSEKLSSIKFSGEIGTPSNFIKPNYLDYGIVLKENESQYFQVKNSNKVLVVQSLFVLRLNYSNAQKK